jgi:hypothetical protein
MMTGLSEIALSCVRKFSNDERGKRCGLGGHCSGNKQQSKLCW